jgi:hypothetical protein
MLAILGTLASPVLSLFRAVFPQTPRNQQISGRGNNISAGRDINVHVGTLQVQVGTLQAESQADALVKAIEGLVSASAGRIAIAGQAGQALPLNGEAARAMRDNVKQNLYGKPSQVVRALQDAADLARGLGQDADLLWIMAELDGYSKVQKEFPAGTEPYASAAAYRTLTPYFLMQDASGSLTDLRFHPVFYPEPLHAIARILEMANSTPGEITVDIDPRSDRVFVSAVNEIIGAPVPDTLRLYFQPSDLQGIVDGVRVRLSTFISPKVAAC